MTTDTEYFERGINLRHGYLTEYYVEDEAFVVKVPRRLKDVGVLLEPMTVAQKGITQAYEIQRRMKVWRPRTAAVMGSGTLGLLASLVLRLRGLDVTTFGRTPKPYLNADLLDAIGARYWNTTDGSIADAAAAHGPFDLIFEGTGSSAVVFESTLALARNGVLVLSSITGGSRRIEVPADRINLEFVLGNKVMVGTVNASRENFETGVADMAQAEAEYPGWLSQLLTHPVRGLDNYRQLFDHLQHPEGAIKIFCEVDRMEGDL
jgi:threonine dehydrogenase-like Zn-dependent dehydrogenase